MNVSLGQYADISSTTLLLSLCASLSSVAVGRPRPVRALPAALFRFSRMDPPADAAESFREANMFAMLFPEEAGADGRAVGPRSVSRRV